MRDVFIIVLVITIILTGIGVMDFYLSEKKCSLIAGKMQMEHDYALMTGCMVKVDGKFSPLKYYRVIK